MTEVPSFYNVEFPMDYPIIAPFYADIDIRKAGQVFFHFSYDVLFCNGTMEVGDGSETIWKKITTRNGLFVDATMSMYNLILFIYKIY